MMRISSLLSDSVGYKNFLDNAGNTVYVGVDGVLLQNVISADEEAGFVLAAVCDSNGAIERPLRTKLHSGLVKIEIVKGKVNGSQT